MGKDEVVLVSRTLAWEIFNPCPNFPYDSLVGTQGFGDVCIDFD